MASNILRALVRAIGLPAAISLTRVYGGREIRVPTYITRVHPLAVAIGWDAARALCVEFGGTALDVPVERTALIEQRNALIRDQYRAGASIKALASRYGLSRTMVRKVLLDGACRAERMVGNSSTMSP